jgi:formylglycine-generating enzyme required for sulfatase activity
MIMVHVPAGEFLMGSDLTRDAGAHESEEPQHKVYLDEYWMGRYPVTNRQYQTFVQAMVTSSPFHWQNGKIPGGLEDHPVVNVSWDEAVKFCQWASQVSGQKIALPTESQWEKAARGTDGRIYPWGDQPPDKSRCNFDRKVGTTTPVGKYSPAGDSPYGCADMAGNVWDWVADWYDEKYYGNSPNRNPSGPASGRYSVLRGGSWNSYDWLLRSAYRYRHPPDTRYNYNGFRCVCSPDPGILVAGMLGF